MINFIIYALFVIDAVAACQDGEFRPHSDCTKFLQCANGVLVEQNCPSGLHWSVKESRCEWPNIAGCTSSNDPSETCTDGEFRPHPDCTKFLQCANGVLVEQNCPSGLHWSVKESRCEWPNIAGCTSSNDPPETCTNGEFRPHSDCTKFLQCANGVLVEQNCPSGLHWSVKESRCEWPNIAGCASSNDPSETCTKGEYRRHPDCTKFQQCANGVLVVHDCPGGLHWNVAKTTCDWPYFAECTPETR